MGHKTTHQPINLLLEEKVSAKQTDEVVAERQGSLFEGAVTATAVTEGVIFSETAGIARVTL